MGVITCFTAVSRKQLATFLADPEKLDRFLARDRNSIDIDKAHEALLCLLGRASSDEAWETVSKAIFGGADTDEEGGYGSVRYLTAEEVREVADALSAISPKDLMVVYSAEALTLVDDNGSWLWEEPEKALRYLLPHYQSLVAFYQAAAREQKAVLQYEV
jgi:hypothetical protein